MIDYAFAFCHFSNLFSDNYDDDIVVVVRCEMFWVRKNQIGSQKSDHFQCSRFEEDSFIEVST